MKKRLFENRVKNIVRSAINEAMSEEEYRENFKRNVFKANQHLYTALTFFNDPNQEPLVEQIQEAFKLTNDVAYYLERE